MVKKYTFQLLYVANHHCLIFPDVGKAVWHKIKGGIPAKKL